jgi:hypothetical protein
MRKEKELTVAYKKSILLNLDQQFLLKWQAKSSQKEKA